MRWYTIEQYFKRHGMRWLEKLFAKELLSPQRVEFSKIKRILVVRQHDMLGDFLLSTPVLRALRQNFPNAHIGVVVREYFTEIVQPHDDVDEVLAFYERGRRWTFERLRSFWRQLRAPWDLAVVLNTVSHSLTSDLIAHFSGTKFVLGSEHRVFPGCKKNFFYNLLAPYQETKKHQSERNLDIVRHLGVTANDPSEVMCVRETEREAARRKLLDLGWRAEGLVIGMHVGAGKLTNRWPVARFAELAQHLHEAYSARIMLFWGAHEAELAAGFNEAVRFKPIKVGPGSLRELAAYFTHCAALVCNDTGVMHVGAAVGTPLVAVFGPTDPEEWKPLGKKFVAVRGEEQNVENVTTHQAMQALLFLLQQELKWHRSVTEIMPPQEGVAV
ncbi:MAG: glycosyltransferase family 9 protein [bacterium]